MARIEVMKCHADNKNTPLTTSTRIVAPSNYKTHIESRKGCFSVEDKSNKRSMPPPGKVFVHPVNGHLSNVWCCRR